MNQIDALRQFERTAIRPKLTEQIQAVDSYFREHYPVLKQQLLDNLREFCRTIAIQQQAGGKGAIAYLNLSLLRVSLEETAPVYQWNAYDAAWYQDRAACAHEYDAGWAFGYLEALITGLEPERKSYAGVITPQDLRAVRQTVARHFHHYVVQLALLALRELPAVAELQQLRLADRLLILAGEYLDICRVVYVRDERPRQSAATKQYMERHSWCSHRVFKNCDLAHGHYANSNLCYSTFDGSSLSGSDLQNALLTGSTLRRCNLTGANLAHSDLHDADLSEADLQNANLSQIKAGAYPASLPQPPLDLDQLTDSRQLGATPIPAYYHLNLQNANLRAANFSGADLRGADLRGAGFGQTDFTDCQLDNALFSRDAQPELPLTQQQMDVINWKEAE